MHGRCHRAVISGLFHIGHRPCKLLIKKILGGEHSTKLTTLGLLEVSKIRLQRCGVSTCDCLALALRQHPLGRGLTQIEMPPNFAQVNARKPKSSVRALKSIRDVRSGLHSSFESLLGQFSAATLELNPSIGSSQMAQRLTSRVCEMLGPRAAALALSGATQWEIANVSGSPGGWNDRVKTELANRLAEQALLSSTVLRQDTAEALLGRDLAQILGWREIVLLPLTGRGGSALGLLCLADLAHPLSTTENELLAALASHASVAIENVRMIGRIEQSRKQWVEDFDAISDLIVVHDALGKVLRLNRALANLMNVHPTAIIGWDVNALAVLAAPRKSLCPFCHDPENSREEFTYQVKDRTYGVSTSRIESEEGDVRTIHILKDITERREAERRYRRERDFNKNILNNTQSMILVLDTAGLISYANRRCAEAGYREQDFLGHRLADLVAPLRRGMFLEAFERTLEGMAVELEVSLSRGSRASGQFSISLSPMRDESGQINSVVVVMSDITDAADLQAKLMHTEKMAALGQLVAGVAHEVNNPLAAIVGFTDLLLENPTIPAEAKQDLQVILDEAQRTRVIVQNLLSFARQMPSQQEPVDVNSILRQTLKLRAYDFSHHGLEVCEKYAQTLPLLVGDPHQLQQLFLNVLNNAFDAIQESGRPGKIEIATFDRGGCLEIAFRDNGAGISHPDRIFDPFFTTKEVGKGTGLGLSICYGIVRAHRGEILARNNPDGPGCTFSVRLPMAHSATALRAEAAQ
jgi:PAS domain S-box-containing protein